MQPRQRVGNPILLQVVADRHLPAEAVPPERNRHLSHMVGRRLNQHRHLQIRQLERIRQPTLLAKVRQRNDDPIDLSRMRLEQRRALLCILVGLYRPMRRLFRTQHKRLDARSLQRRNHLQPSTGGKVAGKKSTVAHNHTHRHLLRHKCSRIHVCLGSWSRNLFHVDSLQQQLEPTGAKSDRIKSAKHRQQRTPPQCRM